MENDRRLDRFVKLKNVAAEDVEESEETEEGPGLGLSLPDYRTKTEIQSTLSVAIKMWKI